MYFTLKKSKMTAWWVAKRSNIFTFVNICSKQELPDDLIVVGYMKDSVGEGYYPDLATSTNYVVEVTKKGVITSKGSFYPFEEAHALYIMFLDILNSQHENYVVANRWKLLGRSRMIADIVKNGEICKDVKFDFDSDYKNITLCGFSEQLDATVVVSTFSRRELVCATFHIPYSIKDDIKENAEFAFESKKREYIERIRSFIS